MRDISPKIDLVYSCFLEERLYKPLRNKKFHEVSAEIPGVDWEKSRYGKVRGLFVRLPRGRKSVLCTLIVNIAHWNLTLLATYLICTMSSELSSFWRIAPANHVFQKLR
jgi:hypothetical protein